jgi:hypothetical protein
MEPLRRVDVATALRERCSVVDFGPLKGSAPAAGTVPSARLAKMSEPRQPSLDFATLPDGEQTWAVIRFGEGPTPLVVHVPHASVFVPPEEGPGCCLTTPS